MRKSNYAFHALPPPLQKEGPPPSNVVIEKYIKTIFISNRVEGGDGGGNK
jgi:hypothetical protein